MYSYSARCGCHASNARAVNAYYVCHSISRPRARAPQPFGLVTQLARASSGSRANADELAAPTELSLPQLCLAVSAKELVTGVSSKGRGGLEGGDKSAVESGQAASVVEVEGEGEAVADSEKNELFRERKPLSFFAVDCRPKSQVRRAGVWGPLWDRDRLCLNGMWVLRVEVEVGVVGLASGRCEHHCGL